MRRMIAILGGLALAIVLGQFPEYAQQYTQRLGGAVDELRVIVDNFDREATANGLDRQQALTRYDGAADAFLVGQGQAMTRTFGRYETLRVALAEIEGATPLERLQNLPLYLDTDICARTLAAYRPAVPVTPEGLIYALAGLALGYLLVSALFRLVGLVWRRPRRYTYPTAR